MTLRTENLIETIKKMQSTKIHDIDETVGEMAKKGSQEEWTSNHVEAIINTVLAMRNRWNSFGEPRFEEYQCKYSHIDTLYKLKDLMNEHNEKDFCNKVLGFNITKDNNWRYEMLRDLIDAFIKYQQEMGLESDRDAMIKWAIEFDPSIIENDPVVKINNVGLATIQNLRLCLGIDTIKPDVHVKNALVKIGLGNEVQVCELISELTGVSCRELDQIFWIWGQNQMK